MNAESARADIPSDRLYLSSFDVDVLLAENSSVSRVAIIEKVAQAYRQEHFSAHELALAEQIFRVMMRDVAAEVRLALAEQLKDMEHIPRDILLHLASDENEVALPIVEMSQLLSDADLVQLIETSRDSVRIEKIAARPHISERVSGAVVETRYPQAVEALLANHTAQISEQTLETVIEAFAYEPDIVASLGARNALPISVVEKLVSVASEQMAEQLRSRYEMDSERVRQFTEKARETATLALLEGHVTREEIEALVGRIHSEGRLNSSMVFTALCRGQWSFFISALAHLANIPYDNAARLATDKGQLGFTALYQKAKLPENLFAATIAVLRHIIALQSEPELPGSATYADILANRLIQQSSSEQVPNMAYMLALARQR